MLPDYYMLDIFGDNIHNRRESVAANYPNLMADNEDARDHEEPMIKGDTKLLDDHAPWVTSELELISSPPQLLVTWQKIIQT